MLLALADAVIVQRGWQVVGGDELLGKSSDIPDETGRDADILIDDDPRQHTHPLGRLTVVYRPLCFSEPGRGDIGGCRPDSRLDLPQVHLEIAQGFLKTFVGYPVQISSFLIRTSMSIPSRGNQSRVAG
jgi:hypothetical protein